MTKTDEIKKLKEDIEDLKTIIEYLALCLPDVEQQTLYAMLNMQMFKSIIRTLERN